MGFFHTTYYFVNRTRITTGRQLNCSQRIKNERISSFWNLYFCVGLPVCPKMMATCNGLAPKITLIEVILFKSRFHVEIDRKKLNQISYLLVKFHLLLWKIFVDRVRLGRPSNYPHVTPYELFEFYSIIKSLQSVIYWMMFFIEARK